MNKVFLIGNLTKDPELNQTANGVAYCKFTVAVSRAAKDVNGEKVTDFISCIAWKQRAELITKYCGKGSKIAVCGELQINQYTAQDSTKRYVSEILCNDIEFCSWKASDNGATEEEKTKKTIERYQQSKIIVPTSDDDLPF